MVILLRICLIGLVLVISGCNTSKVLDLENTPASSATRQEITDFVKVGVTSSNRVIETFGDPTSRTEIEGGGYALDYSSFQDDGFVVITFDKNDVASEVRSSDQL